MKVHLLIRAYIYIYRERKTKTERYRERQGETERYTERERDKLCPVKKKERKQVTCIKSEPWKELFTPSQPGQLYEC